MTNKGLIRRDFSAKRSTYYQANYAVHTSANRVRRARRDLVSDLATPHAENALVMDAGCGPAILFTEVLDVCRQYTAVDLTKENLDHIREHNLARNLVCRMGDLDLPLPFEGEFDLIISSGALEYTSNPVHSLRLLTERLAPKGSIVVTFPNAWSPYRLWSEFVYTPSVRIVRCLFGGGHQNYTRHLVSPQRLRHALEELGFAVRLSYCGEKLLPQPLDQLFPRIDDWLASRLSSAPRCVKSIVCTELIAYAFRKQ